MKAEKVITTVETADNTIQLIYKILALIAESQNVFYAVCFVSGITIACIIYWTVKLFLSHLQQRNEYRILESVEKALDRNTNILSAIKEKFSLYND